MAGVCARGLSQRLLTLRLFDVRIECPSVAADGRPHRVDEILL